MPKQPRRSKRIGSSAIAHHPTVISRMRRTPSAASESVSPLQQARGTLNSPLTHDDIPALVQEVVQAISKGGHLICDGPAAGNTPAYSIEYNEEIQRPLASSLIDSTRATSRSTNRESATYLHLTQEDIPSLVQQVLQALPGATTHNNNAGDHYPPQQSNSGSSPSIEQSSQPPPSEL